MQAGGPEGCQNFDIIWPSIPMTDRDTNRPSRLIPNFRDGNGSLSR
jgi:hypothetical protein